MKILGMEIPDEVAEAIVAKAKTEELFKEYLKEMEWEFKSLQRNKTVCREIEFEKKNYPGCKLLFRILYDADGYFEIGSSGCPDDKGVIVIDIAYDGNHPLREVETRLFTHIYKTYKTSIIDPYPIFDLEGHFIDIEFKKGSCLDNLIEDIEERIPNVTVECMDNVIRIQMKSNA